jgi:hypothetical protein
MNERMRRTFDQAAGVPREGVGYDNLCLHPPSIEEEEEEKHKL